MASDINEQALLSLQTWGPFAKNKHKINKNS